MYFDLDGLGAIQVVGDLDDLSLQGITFLVAIQFYSGTFRNRTPHENRYSQSSTETSFALSEKQAPNISVP